VRLHPEFKDSCVSLALFALCLVHLATLPTALHQVQAVTLLSSEPRRQPAPFPAVIYKAIGSGAAVEIARHSLGERSGSGTGAAALPCRVETAGFQLERYGAKARAAGAQLRQQFL